MGFYGNITNTSKTTFSFDKIYANRRDMDADCALGDGVFLGRYVLVEYGATVLNDIQEVYTDGSLTTRINTFYSDPTKRDSIYIVPWVERKIVKARVNFSSGSRYDYYQGVLENSSRNQIWKKLSGYSVIENTPDDEAYKLNYDIDYQKYGRGYDSTVWIKQFINNEEKYVQIAELNTIVPVFEILPQAPQDIYTLIDLNEDTYQPNKYYYFNGTSYVQDTGPFVADRKYYSVYTNPDGTPYWPPYVSIDEINSTNINYRIQVPTNFLLNLDPQNIDFNAAGFDEKIHHLSNEENSITYTLGTTNYPYYYDVEQDGITGEYKTNDIKNLVIKLPGLGNAACRVYDLLYGEERRKSNYNSNNVSGALNRLNKKFNNVNLEASKLLYASPEEDADTGDKIIKSAEILGDSWINYKAIPNADNKLTQFKLFHTSIKLDNKTIAPNANQTPKFGETIEIPSFTVDDCGHVISQSETRNITIPKGSYQSDDTGNVITSLTFTPENGKFVEIKDYLGNLQIGVEDYTNADLGLNSTSTLKDSINAISTKLASNLSAAENYVNNKIDTLKVEDQAVSKEFVTAVSEEKGKIKVTRTSLKADDIPSLTHAKISDWDTEVTNKLSTLETNLTTNINSRALQSALDTHTNSNIHITPEERTAWNAKLDSIPNTYIQTTDKFTVNNDSKTIQQLCAYIDTLAERIKILEDNSTTTS